MFFQADFFACAHSLDPDINNFNRSFSVVVGIKLLMGFVKIRYERKTGSCSISLRDGDLVGLAEIPEVERRNYGDALFFEAVFLHGFKTFLLKYNKIFIQLFLAHFFSRFQDGF